MSEVQPTKSTVGEFARELSAPVAVGAPLGSLVANMRAKSVFATKSPEVKIGIWECSPGRFRRQIIPAAVCHVLSGEGTFIPDVGEPFAISPGVVIHFPQECPGIWDIRSTIRKVFVSFNQIGHK